MQCPQCGKEMTGDVCTACSSNEPAEGSPRWYADGIAHLTTQKQYALARELLNEALETYPESAALWYNGAILEEMVGQRDAAIKRYKKVLELRPDLDKPRKALERLLGRPLAPPAAPAAAPAPAPAPPVAEVAAPRPTIGTAQVTMADTVPRPGRAEPTAKPHPPQVKTIPAPPTPAKVVKKASVGENTTPADLDLQSLPDLPEAEAAVEQVAAICKMWYMIGKICGFLSIASFLMLTIFLFAGKGPLFIIDLVILLVLVTLYFIGTALGAEYKSFRKPG